MKRNLFLYSLVSSWKLLTEPQRRSGLVVLLLMFVNSVLDIASLASLIPLFTLILDEQSAENPFLKALYNFTGVQSEQQMIILIGVAVVAFVIVKNIISLLILRNQASFAMKVYEYFSMRSFDYYYEKGFLYFQQTNSNEVVRNVSNVPANFANMMLLPLISFMNELMVVVLILVSLSMINFNIIILLTATVLPASWLFYTLLKKKIKYYDERRLNLLPVMNNNLYQSIFGYVEVIISGNRNFFYRTFKKHVAEMRGIQVFSQVLKVSPPKVMETAVIISVVLILIYGVFYFESKSALMQLMGIYALAAYRMVPSINRIMNYVISIKGYQYCFEYLSPVKDHQTPETNPKEALNFEQTLRVKGVSFKYERGEEQVLNDIDLEIRVGEKIGIIGKSGSGKSTLMNILLGFLKPIKGEILVDDVEINSGNRLSWQKLLGYVQQDVYLIDGTLAENVAFGVDPELIDQDRVKWAVSLASLDSLVNQSKDHIHLWVGERGALLSGGQRQRIGIARALYKGCKVLFLDEATSALDQETENEINESIVRLSGEGLTIVIIAHRLSTLKNCHRIIELENGRIANRNVQDVIKNE